MIEITLKLPEDLVRDGQEFDMFADEAVIEIFQAELDRRVMEFVNAEVHAYRAEKAAHEAKKIDSE